ncbi:thioester domain-containing protein [Micromonospora sp. SH-82]|uniref:thioester domain-containing protein n=1 Tax=Micromonospora sp. SH-82 TaxID=3132938 RepID=UPI003EBEC915
MFGRRGRRWARLAVAGVVGSALALGVAGPAAAEGPVTGRATEKPGTEVVLQLNSRPETTSALELEIEGRKVPVFCIDFHTPVALDGDYQEGTWDESQVKNLAKVQWVLTHGYPNVDGDALLAAAGAEVPETGFRKETVLYFGTQTAIWHFSDNVRLADRANRPNLTRPVEYRAIKKLYDYLIANATDAPEPEAELSVDPRAAEVAVGEKAGPFTVRGPAGEIALRVEGGSAVDAEGQPVTTTANEGRFWLNRDGVGKVTVTLTAEDSVSFGRVFLFAGGKNRYQKLILGGSTGSQLTAEAGAVFTPAPEPTPSSPTPSEPPQSPSPSPSPSESTTTPPVESPEPSSSTPQESPAPSTSPVSGGGNLPLTGSPIAVAASIGVLLFAVGAITVLVLRRRKVRFTA